MTPVVRPEEVTQHSSLYLKRRHCDGDSFRTQSRSKTSFWTSLRLAENRQRPFSIRCQYEQVVMVVGGHAVRADPVRCQFTSDDGKKFDRFQTGVYAKSDLSAGQGDASLLPRYAVSESRPRFRESYR